MKRLTLLLLTLLGTTYFAQEDQVTKLKNLSETTFAKYVIEHEGGNEYSFNGCCADHYTIEKSSFRGDYLKFDFLRKGSSLTPGMYVPDEEAFPATFVRARYEGNQEMIEKYDVIERFNEDRIVFLGEWVYVLEWNSKDDFVIDKVLRAGEVSGAQAVKASFKAKKLMKQADHYATLKTYLDKAFAKQAELLPTWQKENSALIQKRLENKKKVLAEINGYNDAFWESEEGQAILQNNKNYENAQKSLVKIVNNSGHSIRLVGDGHGATTIENGQSKKFSCDINVYYSTRGPEETGAIADGKADLVYSANSKCNGELEIK
ncbi:hypothetical protein [Parvicella tangerina]|nr:hypothetical protein [Parvicella tangerina]